jgi:tubulin--tyrosine ligase
MKGYWFEEGYIRTAGYEFDVENFEREIHLTNDAVQKYTPNYGRFEPANKISYTEFQKYLDQTYPKQDFSFFDNILPRMKEICLDAIKSACLKISPEKL